jgi:hypothetical protein
MSREKALPADVADWKVRLRHPERIARLMLAVALAYLWLCSLGVRLIHRAKLVDRTGRRDRSVFTIGRQRLNRLLKLDQPIPVSCGC